MFQVFLKGLQVYGHHGVTDEEQAIGHRLTFDVTLDVFGAADETDRVEDTVDYGDLARLIASRAAGERHRTLERLSGDIAAMILIAYPAVRRVELSVAKLAPPFPEVADFAGVRVVLDRTKP
ncbi:MAG: dihydroneopterin aldolase [Armatimonadetes bacterium]|nr:dihydroneopterin aldolase [Armatimonadota bacterium]